MSQPVGMLLGAEVMLETIRNGNKKQSHNLPSIQNIALGWFVGRDLTRMKVNKEVLKIGYPHYKMNGWITNLHIR